MAASTALAAPQIPPHPAPLGTIALWDSPGCVGSPDIPDTILFSSPPCGVIIPSGRSFAVTTLQDGCTGIVSPPWFSNSCFGNSCWWRVIVEFYETNDCTSGGSLAALPISAAPSGCLSLNTDPFSYSVTCNFWGSIYTFVKIRGEATGARIVYFLFCFLGGGRDWRV